MNYIYYQTKTKFINTGDALINNALISVLRRYGELRCNCSSDIPDSFIKELDIKSNEMFVCNSELSFMISIIKSAFYLSKKDKIYLFSGLGHHFGSSKRKMFRNYIAGLVIFPIYKLFGIKIIRLGFSIGPFSKGLARSEWVRSLFLDEYLVRDQNSLSLAKKLNIRKARFCPDMSWLYLIDKKRVINNGNIVTICLRDSIFDNDDPDYKNAIIKKLDECLYDINHMKKNMKIIFMYQVSEDMNFTLFLFNKYKDKYNCYFEKKQLDLSLAEHYYSKSIINISNRMHSILLCYKYGSLPIALTDLAKHKKISQTLNDCDINEIGIDIYSENKIVSLLNNKDSVLKKLFSIEEKNQKKIISFLDDIFK